MRGALWRSGPPGSSSSTMPAISTSSPGSKPGGPQRLDHPERAQALLDVSSVVVLDVVASDQAVDAPALHPKETRPDPVDSVASRPRRAGRRGAWPEARPPPAAARQRAPARRSRREAMEPLAGGCRRRVDRDIEGGLIPEATIALSASPGDRPPGPPWTGRGCAAGRPGRAGDRAARPRPWRGFRRGPSRRAEQGRERAPAAGSARRGRGTRGRGPAPALAPSIRPGMSASTSWRSSRSSVPSTGCSVVNG